MSPTANRQHEQSTACDPVSQELVQNRSLTPEISSKADTSISSGVKAPSVPSSIGEGSIWLRCRVRQGRLGSMESSTQG